MHSELVQYNKAGSLAVSPLIPSVAGVYYALDARVPNCWDWLSYVLLCYIFRKYVTIYLSVVHLITADTNAIERHVSILIILVI